MATLTSSDAAHLLRRVGFGGSTAEITALTGLTREAAVADVLDFSAAPTVVAPADLGDENQWWAHSNAIDWWMHRMADTPKPLQEKIALLWHGHFCSGQEAVGDMRDMFDQNQLFRPAGPGNAGGLGLANFRDLCWQVSIGGAMLVYLNNDTNVRGAEQENFGRELMELFTLGVGNYTESDVISMAKAWTGHNTVGWNGSEYDATYLFRANRHDTTNKTLFGITQNWDAPDTVDELVNGSKRSTTAQFIAATVYQFFTREAASPSTVQQLADAFVAGGMSIRPLIEAVLLHDDFWAPATRYAIVRSPVEFVVATLKQTGYRFTASSAEGRNFLEPMGQTPFEPPNVAGWGVNGYWLSTATAWARGNFASWLRWKVGDGANQLPFLPELKAGSNGRVALSAAAAITLLLDRLGIVEPSPATRARLEAWYSAANTPSNGWSIRGNALMLGLLTPDFQLA
jgi:uncharacterized protein (DUF1800 family)